MVLQAVVDIDNTLWEFSSVLYEELKIFNPLIPPPEKWERWDFFTPYVSSTIFYRTIGEIHKRQDEYGVYPDAGEFLENLKRMDFRIVIASHRDKEAEEATRKWLKKHNLTFDELHLSYDKSVLFDYCAVVVDDSPFVLEKAKSHGILATGLEHPWNRGNGFLLFKTLSQVLAFIQENLKI